jgi:hypothetical protein
MDKDLEQFVGEVMSKMDAYLEGKDDGKAEVWLSHKQHTMAMFRTVFSCLAFLASALVLYKVW